MKAGIVIDSWKIDIFRRNLKSSGYSFIEAGHLPEDCLLLTVTTDNVIALNEVVTAANLEAAKTGKPNDNQPQ